MDQNKTFEIEFNGLLLTVLPLTDHSFDIYNKTDKICNLHGLPKAKKTEWHTEELVPEATVAQIGKAIESKIKAANAA